MTETTQKIHDDVLKAKAAIEKALDKTHSDKINWSPSETARSPLMIVVHVANATGALHNWFLGTPFDFAAMSANDKPMRDEERKITDKAEALALLQTKVDGCLEWVGTLTEEDLQKEIQMPFGPIPLGSALEFISFHMQSHVPQMHYIQTIYGDTTWYMG